MREHFADSEETLCVSTSDVSRNQKTGFAPLWRPQLNDIYIYISSYNEKDTLLSVFSDSGDVLLSRAVAHQVSSALRSLTTVFGMGTGVTFLLLPPNVCQRSFDPLTRFFLFSKTESEKFQIRVLLFFFSMAYSIMFRSSPRPISIGQLNTLPYLHLRPINHIVYVGSY